MQLFMIRRRGSALTAIAAVLATASCGHSDPPSSAAPPPEEGAFGTASPLRLTYNPGSDVAASFSDDGRFIVYTYATTGRQDRDRCLGIMPAAGGTRVFERCETRLAYNDSSDTFTSGALDAEGRLLFLRSTSRIAAQVPSGPGLYLAPTPDAPAVRILSLPLVIGGETATWLSDIRWAGATGFTALAQEITVVPRCPGCTLRDTTFIPLFVVRGTIVSGAATLQAIAGTDGATVYAMSSDGSQVLFGRGGPTLELVAASGGTPTTVTTIPIGTPTDRITGLGCARDLCIVSTLYERLPPSGFGISYSLYSVAFSGGPLTQRAGSDAAIWTRPRLSPTNTNILLQVESGAARDLYLYQGQL